MISISIRAGNVSRLRSVFGILAGNGYNWLPARDRGAALLGYDLTTEALGRAATESKTIYVDGLTKTIYNSVSGSVTHAVRAEGGMNTVTRLIEQAFPPVKLNDTYSASIDGRFVVAGCQRVPFAKVLEVAKAIREQS